MKKWILGLCVLMTGCAIEARPYDSSRQCFGELENVGFQAPATGCTDNIVIAADEDGKCWRFINGCVPDDFDQQNPRCLALEDNVCSSK